jgi:hypothetical protein
VNTGFARPIGSGAEGDDFAVLFIINGRSIATRGLAGDQGGAAQCSEGTGGKIGSHGTYAGMGTGKERGNEFDPYGDRADSVPVDDAEKATASALNRLLCKLLFISGRLSRQIHITEIV